MPAVLPGDRAMLQECHQEAQYLPPPLHLPHSQQAATDPKRQRQKKKKAAKLENGKNSGVKIQEWKAGQLHQRVACVQA